MEGLLFMLVHTRTFRFLWHRRSFSNCIPGQLMLIGVKQRGFVMFCEQVLQHTFKHYSFAYSTDMQPIKVGFQQCWSFLSVIMILLQEYYLHCTNRCHQIPWLFEQFVYGKLFVSCQVCIAHCADILIVGVITLWRWLGWNTDSVAEHWRDNSALSACARKLPLFYAF